MPPRQTRRYLRSFADFDDPAADIKKRFRFVGDTGAFHFLWQVGEDVPNYEVLAAKQ